MSEHALLALEDGTVFRGRAIGAEGQSVGEVVFNTSMTGYQEILTDPSYAGQIITLTYPHIGNTGTNSLDVESDRIWAAGLIIRDLAFAASNWRSQLSLSDFLKKQNIVGIAEIDTRKLTRLLREKGALNGCLQAGKFVNETEALKQAKAYPGLKGADLAADVSTDKIYEWTEGTEGWVDFPAEKNIPRAKKLFHVVAYDFGIKKNILRLLVDHGCRVTVVPAKTPIKDVLAMKPDGVFFSNGPGDPAACDYAIKSLQGFLDAQIPWFGICLGHQLLGLAVGAKTTKMKFGHHGANHPVIDLKTGKILISTQNHGFAVDEKTMPENLKTTHRSLFDDSLQGIELTDKPAFAFQGHPEAGPGPHDIHPLFERFVELMRAHKRTNK